MAFSCLTPSNVEKYAGSWAPISAVLPGQAPLAEINKTSEDISFVFLVRRDKRGSDRSQHYSQVAARSGPSRVRGASRGRGSWRAAER